MRIKRNCIFVWFFSLVFIYQVQTQELIFKSPERGFTSWLPARNWEEALLSGNGTIGAMVIGRPHDETIILNHAFLYLPASEPIQPIDQASRLDEIRQLMLDGKFEEATKVPVEISMEEGYGGTRWTDPYMPAFDIRLNMEPSNIKQYVRSVDYQTGEASVHWEDAGGKFQRKLFVSRYDSIVVLSIRGAGKVNCRLEFTARPYEWSQRHQVRNNIEETVINSSGNWLTYRSSFKRRWEGSLQGYEGVGRVISKGGSSSVEGNRIVIKDADEVLLLVRIEPSYDYTNSQVDQIKKLLVDISADYDALLKRHVNIHGKLFNRMRLDLGGGEDRALDSEAMVLKAQKEVSSAIIERLFDASRYNILCATGTNPPNLQGIWNGNWTPPWSSDFTQNGNVPVAISSFLCGNLPELMMAYFDYQDKMLPYYRDNARRLYGCRGIHVPSRTSTHGWDIHFSETWCMTFWTAGAGWVSSFYYDYYLYTEDKKFLKERAYPFMKEAALFYEDFLTIGGNGKYVFNPSYSPENNPANSKSQACINATMDVMVAKQLLRNCIDAGKVLQIKNDKIKKWESMLSIMPDYMINNDGALREYMWDNLQDNYAHRHASHLYGLFDIIDPEIAGNPALIEASRNAIEERMKVRRAQNGGEMAFGMVQLAFAAANMGESEAAFEMVNWLASRYWTSSLATLHNPGSLFNMDLSGGFPAVIIKMLAYSEPGFISLLPALPAEWPKGKIEGILLRGQTEIKSLAWEGKNISLVLHSRIDQKVVIKVPDNISSVVPADKKTKLKRISGKPDRFLLILPANRDVTISIALN